MTYGARRLTVRHGSTLAVDGVDLEVPSGRVTAVIGGDGAGKSTLLRTLAGGLTPTAGTVRRPARARLAYLPAVGGCWSDLSVDENLDFVAHTYGVAGPDAARRRADLLERTGLTGFGARLAGSLSGGERQKLAVAAALLPRPDLLVLDEPTTGVDPRSRVEVWRLVAAAAAEGAAVVLATTYLDEAERAEWVLVLQDGRAVVEGAPEAIRAAVPGSVVVTDAPDDRCTAWRRGPVWHQWRPEGGGDGIEPDLEDAVIVAALVAGRR